MIADAETMLWPVLLFIGKALFFYIMHYALPAFFNTRE